MRGRFAAGRKEEKGEEVKIVHTPTSKNLCMHLIVYFSVRVNFDCVINCGFLCYAHFFAFWN